MVRPTGGGQMEQVKTTYYFDLADRHFGGGLEKWLREERALGTTQEKIHYLLWSEHDIPLSVATVVRWCKLFGI